MLSGFELLKTRDFGDVINLSEYENQINFMLPPLYKLFLSTFKVGKNYPLKNEKFWNPVYKDYYFCDSALYYPLKDDVKWFLSISYFDAIEEVVKSHLSYLEKEEAWINFGFLRIASIGQGGGLYIGTRPENIDAIYQIVWDFDEPFFKVAPNIFELVKGFSLTGLNDLPNNFKVSQLYKNWGEDFWRIREEDDKIPPPQDVVH